jgi:hypothetical protein
MRSPYVEPDPPGETQRDRTIKLALALAALALIAAFVVSCVIALDQPPCPRSPSEEARYPDRIDC